VAGGGAPGGTGARGVGGRDDEGGVGTRGTNDAGTGGAGEASAGLEQRSPFTGMLARVEAVASNAPLGVDCVEVKGIEPQPYDTARGPCLDLTMRGSGPSMPGCVAPGDAVPAPGLSGAGFGLPGSPDSLPLPTN
jgi:hypothetical protein